MEYMNNGNISTLLQKIIRSAEAINDSIPFTAEVFFIAANGFNAFELEESEKEEYEVFLRILNGKTFCDDLSCKFLLKYMHSDEYIPDEHIEYMQSKLEKAKKVHDDLEADYIKAMDFDELNVFTEKVIESLF